MDKEDCDWVTASFISERRMQVEKKWQLLEQPPQQEIEALAKELNCQPLFAALCLQRGIDRVEQLKHMIEPSLEDFHSPFLMADMEKAVDRLSQALMSGEKITVYGDYDADGVTSTTLLVESLASLGADVDFYIPNRFEEGYGPNPQAFQLLIDNGTQLILSCDNGIQGHESIALAQDQGVDVIVTDHHELGETLPPAYAIIHPRHPQGTYPFPDLAGVGVAFKLAHALLGDFPQEYLDLVAIGTVADLVEMTGENYYLVKAGLAHLTQSQRLGLLALLQQAGTSPQDIDETTIGFRIGPRLNAAGRMGEASLAVELLMAMDSRQADELAQTIEDMNQERKTITDDIFQQAKENIDPTAKIQVIAGKNWHEGVIGIVASRVVEETGQPTIILSLDEETQKLKGSGRSVGAFNLFQALQSCQSYFESFGGHHMAAGLTLKAERLNDLRHALSVYIEEHYQKEDLQMEVTVDLKAQLAEVSMDLIEEINQLQPFGEGFQPPKFLFENVQTQDMRRIGSDKSHLKFLMVEEGQKTDAIAFSMADKLSDLGDQARLDVLAQLDINEWNGQKKLQCLVEDMRPRGLQVLDKRTSRLPELDLADTDQAFAFFHPNFFRYMFKKYDEPDHFYLIEAGQEPDIKESELTLVDIPVQAQPLQNVLARQQFDKITAIFYSMENVYLEGLAKREDFAKVFKYIFSHEDINYEKHRQTLADYLDLPLNLLNHIIFVFIEVNYVKLDGGMIIKNDKIEQADLTQTQSYLNRKSQLQMEEILLYSSAAEMIDCLQSWSRGE